MRRFGFSDQEARDRCIALGLWPIPFPLGDGHHTEEPFTDEDKSVGSAIAYFLGSLSGTLYEPNGFERMSSADQWAVVARALRIHGLRIANADIDKILKEAECETDHKV